MINFHNFPKIFNKISIVYIFIHLHNIFILSLFFVPLLFQIYIITCNSCLYISPLFFLFNNHCLKSTLSKINIESSSFLVFILHLPPIYFETLCYICFTCEQETSSNMHLRCPLKLGKKIVFILSFKGIKIKTNNIIYPFPMRNEASLHFLFYISHFYFLIFTINICSFRHRLLIFIISSFSNNFWPLHSVL